MTTECKASSSEEPGAGIPHAGICAGGAQQWASLPRYRLTATNNAEGWTYLCNPLNQYTNLADGVMLEPEYDADGNMTATGDGWRYVWNGENRMILASNAQHVVTYAYDHQGRMVAKMVDGNSRQYLWDGYNIVADARTACTNWFVWGMDLSGSLQGAGGVGGLLTEIKDGEPYFSAYDANGNITEYISTNGVTEAHYEYSPFGETVVQSGVPRHSASGATAGDMAVSFTHRFSTKPWCEVAGLSEYEFRKYGPGMGRWISRDPIGEDGGLNFYVLASNDPLNSIDFLGLEEKNTIINISIGYKITITVSYSCCEAPKMVDAYVDYPPFSQGPVAFVEANGFRISDAKKSGCSGEVDDVNFSWTARARHRTCFGIGIGGMHANIWCTEWIPVSVDDNASIADCCCSKCQ